MTTPTPNFKVLIFQGFTFPDAAELDAMCAAGVDGVIVGLNNEDTPNVHGRDASPHLPDRTDLDDTFAWRFGAASGPAALAGCIEACAKRGMVCLPMIWARPTDAYCQAAAEAMEPFLGLDGFGGICHDTERFWHKLLTFAGLTPEQGAQVWAKHFARDGVRHVLTDYASMPPVVAPLAELCQGLIPQAYSRHSWVSKDGVWVAGQTQRVASRTWGKLRLSQPPRLQDGTPVLLPGGVVQERPLWIGLGAYDLGPRPDAWLSAQIQGALDVGCDGLAFWSYEAAKRGGHVKLMLDKIRALKHPAP